MDKTHESQTLTNTNIIGQKQLTKLKQVPLPSSLDLGLTRIYFTTTHDGFARILILLVQIFWIGLIYINGISLGQIVANLPWIPALPALQKVVLQIITMMVTTLFTFFILIMILPIFLSKTIRGVGLTCVFYLILGTIINLLIMMSSFFLFYDSDGHYSSIMVWLTVSGILVWWICIGNWWLSASRSRKQLIKSIIKMYDLGFK